MGDRGRAPALALRPRVTLAGALGAGALSATAPPSGTPPPGFLGRGRGVDVVIRAAGGAGRCARGGWRGGGRSAHPDWGVGAPGAGASPSPLPRPPGALWLGRGRPGRAKFTRGQRSLQPLGTFFALFFL